MKRILAFFVLLSVVASVAACTKKKEPIIGYDPEIPPEWAEEAERAEKDPYRQVERTNDFYGIWRNAATGEYYHFYEGHIYLLDSLDAGEDEYSLEHIVVIEQTMTKEAAAEYDILAGTPLEKDGQFTIIDMTGELNEIGPLTITVIEEDYKTKTVTADGKEYVFTFVKEVDDVPAGAKI